MGSCSSQELLSSLQLVLVVCSEVGGAEGKQLPGRSTHCVWRHVGRVLVTLGCSYGFVHRLLPSLGYGSG